VTASLFDDPKARHSDPRTSKLAAGDNFGPLCQRVLCTLLETERTDAWRTGATVAELRSRMEFDGLRVPESNSIARRLTTLARMGFVRDTGESRDGGAGQPQIAWASTPEGRAWTRGDKEGT
jgi:hypothetical protein